VIKLLHTADLHLDAPFPWLGERASARRDDFFRTFDNLLTAAIKNEVDLFIVAGDLFDSPWPSAAVVAKVQGGLKRLADRGIVPVILPGGHDSIASHASAYRQAQFPGMLLVDAPGAEPVSVTVRGRPVYLYGSAAQPPVIEKVPHMERSAAEGIHIGLLHGSLEGSAEGERRRRDLAFSLDDLKGWRLDYVALGHYHNFKIVEDDGRAWACYPGSPEGKGFGENGVRRCALVTVDQGGANVESLVVNSAILEEGILDLSGCETADAAARAISARGKPDLLLRLTLTGQVETALDTKELLERCRDRFFHLELRDDTKLLGSALIDRMAEEETVRGLLVRRARRLLDRTPSEQQPMIEEAFRELLLRFRPLGREEK
jgi:DNA repair protein SbcD/Mre11